MVSYTRDLNPYRERAAASPPGLPWLALLLLFAVPLLFRLYLLYIPVPLNMDEAQWTVSARSVLTDPIIWRSTDMQTSGPLNALAISWPVLFGLTPSLLTSRLTGLVLQSLTILGMASLIRRGEALSPGTAAVLTTAAALTLAVNPDFIHYSSELVSLALIVLFCVVYVRLPIEAPAGPWLALCGLIATCLPFAKLQSAPFFLLFHALCLARLVMDIRARRAVAPELLLYLFASSLPVLLLVAPLFCRRRTGRLPHRLSRFGGGIRGREDVANIPGPHSSRYPDGRPHGFSSRSYLRSRPKTPMPHRSAAARTGLMADDAADHVAARPIFFSLRALRPRLPAARGDRPAIWLAAETISLAVRDGADGCSVRRSAGGGSADPPQSGGEFRASADGRRFCAERRRFTAALRLDRRDPPTTPSSCGGGSRN